MTSKSNFVKLIEGLRNNYDKLNEENKNKLEETLQMVLTKFEKRVK